MVKNIKEFIEDNVKKGLIKRDIIISSDVDAAYLVPLVKAWGEYGIGKREIIFLSIVIANKYADQIKKNGKLDCLKITKSSKTSDLGRLSDFKDEEQLFLVSILIAKYGVDEVVNNMKEKWEDIRVMIEQGIKILYCKVYKEKVIDTAIFNTIFNLDEELKI